MHEKYHDGLTVSPVIVCTQYKGVFTVSTQQYVCSLLTSDSRNNI